MTSPPPNSTSPIYSSTFRHEQRSPYARTTRSDDSRIDTHNQFGSQDFSSYASSKAVYEVPLRRQNSQEWRFARPDDRSQSSSVRRFGGGMTSSINRKWDHSDGASFRMHYGGGERADSSVRRIGGAFQASSSLRGFAVTSDSYDYYPSALLAVDAEGQVIGEQYVLGKQISLRNYSIIREATQLATGGQQDRKVAVKIVRRNIDGLDEAENGRVQAELEHEIQIWRFLDHMHLLPLEACFQLEEAQYCFMPLNVGQTLLDLVRANSPQGLSSRLAKSYTYQLASALHYLHREMRVVHRDVKLENCLLEMYLNEPDRPALLQLCGFGVAEWLPSDDEKTAEEIPAQISRTTDAFDKDRGYVAPEILALEEDASSLERERAILSTAVDVWALGVVVYTLNVGAKPFLGAVEPRNGLAILSGNWNRDELRVRGGEEVFELVSGCLAMEVEDRWDIHDVLSSPWLSNVVEDEESKE